MGLFSTIKQYIEDFKIWLMQNKLKFIAVLVLLLIGFTLGVFSVAGSTSNWWCVSRCDYIQLVLYGNFFAVLFRILLEVAIIVSFLFMSQLHKHLQPLKCFVLFVGGIYAGATTFCFFETLGLLAILYLLLYVSMVLCTLILICIKSYCPTEYCKSFDEIWSDSKVLVLAICLLTLVRIVLLFLILRPISGAI